VVIDDAVPSFDSAASLSAGTGLLLSAIVQQNAFVLKSSLADPVHLYSGLRQGLNDHSPALLWLFSADEKQHKNLFTQALNAIALNSRAFSCFSYNPLKEGKFLSSHISLNGNSSVEDEWVKKDLGYFENGEEKSVPYKLTWADWAYSISSWRNHFKVYEEEMGTSVQVSEFISLEKASRAGKIPVIFRVDAEGTLKKYSVSEAVIKTTEASLHAWNILREVSGILTEVPEKLRKQTEAEIAMKFEEEKAQLTRDYENQLKAAEQQFLEKTRVKLREKLVALSQHQNGGN
jgi:hypothetical protein